MRDEGWDEMFTSRMWWGQGRRRKKSGDTGRMAFMLVEELPAWQHPPTSVKAAMLMSTATLPNDAAVGVSARVHSVSYVLTTAGRKRPSCLSPPAC